jgi:hypothetical protein
LRHSDRLAIELCTRLPMNSFPRSVKTDASPVGRFTEARQNLCL